MVPAASRERSGEMKRTVGSPCPGADGEQCFLNVCVFPSVCVCVRKRTFLRVYDRLRLEHVCVAVEMKDSTGCHV